MVNSSILKEAVQNNPELGQKITELADTGLVPAVALAAKIAIIDNDYDALKKNLPLVPQDILSSRRLGVFDRIETLNQMRDVIDVIKSNKMNPSLLENVVNACMAYNLKV